MIWSPDNSVGSPGDEPVRCPKRRWPFGQSRHWNEIEPWSWLRHITPWWLLEWLFDRYHLCWSGMAMWKLGYDWSWSVNRGCFHPFDYCGWYDNIATPEERAEGLRIAGELPKLVVMQPRQKP